MFVTHSCYPEKKYKKMGICDSRSKTSLLLLLHMLASASSAQLPPFSSYNFEQTFTFYQDSSFHQCFQLVPTSSIDENENLINCQMKKRNISIGQNLFHCTSDVFISIFSICDGYHDCTSIGAADESLCNCTQAAGNKHSTCQFADKKDCSQFYHKSRDGKCVVYPEFVLQANNTLLNLSNHEGLFHCFSSKSISSELVNDLILDCGPQGEDEFHLKSLKHGENVFVCSKIDFVPCSAGHSNCFHISQICFYKLREFYRISPCSTGEHLQNCKKFECSNSYKCDESYCISWGYVCDGRWDCPGAMMSWDVLKGELVKIYSNANFLTSVCILKTYATKKETAHLERMSSSAHLIK